LRAGDRIAGPALIREVNATTVIEPGWRAEVTQLDHLLLRRVEPRATREAAGSAPPDPVLLELCRLLAAGLLGCTSEQRIRYRPAVDAGLSELAAASVATWRTAGCFDARERACLLFAEKFVLDPHTIDDADVAAVRDAIGTEATVALTEALALFDGFMRFRRMLGADDPAEPDGVVIVPGPSLAAESLP